MRAIASPAARSSSGEGVTNYLTEAAVDATLRWCSRAAAGSRLLLTYVHLDVLRRPGAFIGTERLFASLGKAGEKLTFGIDPSELEEFLAGRGLSLESDVGAAEYRARHLGAAARKIRGHEFYRVALVRVGLSEQHGSTLHRRGPVPRVAAEPGVVPRERT